MTQAMNGKAIAPLLEVNNLSVPLPLGGDRSYAIKGVDFTMRHGEILCIVGESGSGKSITSHAIMGLLPPRLLPSEGSIVFEGKDLLSFDSRQMEKVRGNRIGMIFQEPMTALNPVLTVGEQLAEMYLAHKSASAAAVRAKVVEALAAVRLPDPEALFHAYPHRLSGGQRQRVMIAMAMLHNPALLIADEPTTALDVTTQAEVLRLVRQMRDEHGTSVLFITHDFGVVAEMADRVLVMRSGEIVEEGPVDAVLDNPQADYTRLLIAAVPRFRPGAAVPGKAESKPLLEMKEVSRLFSRSRGLFRKSSPVVAVNSVSVALTPGETLGVVGESGSGKSTLARCAMRLIDISAGAIRFDGTDISHLRGAALLPFRRKVQMVFQDPYASLNPRQTIDTILTDPIVVQGGSRKPAREKAARMLSLVGLDPKALERYPHEFSGGQRQRIGIARALMVDPAVLIADEPVSSLDVSVQKQVLDLLADIKAELGLSMMFITHDLRVASQICDTIVVMRQGEIVEQGPAHQVLGAPQHDYTRRLVAAVPSPSFFGDGGAQ